MVGVAVLILSILWSTALVFGFHCDSSPVREGRLLGRDADAGVALHLCAAWGRGAARSTMMEEP